MKGYVMREGLSRKEGREARKGCVTGGGREG